MEMIASVRTLTNLVYRSLILFDSIEFPAIFFACTQIWTCINLFKVFTWILYSRARYDLGMTSGNCLCPACVHVFGVSPHTGPTLALLSKIHFASGSDLLGRMAPCIINRLSVPILYSSDSLFIPFPSRALVWRTLAYSDIEHLSRFTRPAVYWLEILVHDQTLLKALVQEEPDFKMIPTISRSHYVPLL